MTDRTRLLWHSNAPWAGTGYGQQTALFAPDLAEVYDLAISSFYGLEGAPIRWEDIPVLPGISPDVSGQHLEQHAKRFFGGDPRGGLVMTLMDVWVLNPAVAAQLNMCCWCPVDHQPPPPSVVEFFMKSGAVPIAMSRFGEGMLGRLDPLYVPHAVDCEIYKPYRVDGKRPRINVPDDAFVVGIVAANKGRPSRKCFVQSLQAFRKLAEAHDNTYLYLHTMMDPNSAQGEDLPSLIKELGIPQDRCRIAGQYEMLFQPYSHEDMAKLYSAMDVLLNPSMGEGFGVPVLEAQACGTPAIVSDFSAMPEVCGAGWHVECDPWWTGLNAWQAIPRVDDIASALEECYGQNEREKLMISQTARKHAMGYDLQRVLKQYMLPALRVVEQRFANQAPVRIKPRGKVAA
jgi:glycosyltransferase involved in cell wall biosynthesis